jgi:hypothetical protein
VASPTAVAAVATEQTTVTTASAVAATATMASSRAAVAPVSVAKGREIGATAERHHQHNTVHAYLLQRLDFANPNPSA